MSLFNTLTVVQNVPTEIWSECWNEQYCNRNDLHQLSRTCWLFRHICLPLLFRRLQHHPPIKSREAELWMFSKRMLEKSIERFEVLTRDPSLYQLRSWVESWELFGELLAYTYRIRETKNRLLNDLSQCGQSTFFAVLPAYHNLKLLKLHQVRIDDASCTALEHLPALETLITHMCRCSLEHSTRTPLPLKTFHVNMLFGSQSILQISPEALTSLSVTSNMERYFTHFTALGPLNNLTHLNTFVLEDWSESFLQLLLHCPQLTSLVVTIFSSATTQTLSQILPPTAIPLLSSYSGPMESVVLFIQGRPVRHITITDEDEDAFPPKTLNSTLAQISLLSPSLQSLAIPSCPIGPDILFTVTSIFGASLLKLEIKYIKRTPPEYDISHSEELRAMRARMGTLQLPPVRNMAVPSDSDSENESTEDSEDDSDFTMSDEEIKMREITEISHRMCPKKLLKLDSGIPLRFQVQNWDKAYLPLISADNNGFPTNDSCSAEGLMDSIVLGHVPLPSALTNLRFVYVHNPRSIESRLDYLEQQSYVRRLSLLYPDLKEMVIFDSKCVWELNDNLWRDIYQ